MNFYQNYKNSELTTVNSNTKAVGANASNETVSLDGKKVIFIGNSFTYYGKCVLEKTQSVLTQEERSNDHGYFYQICKNNGMDVSVTNWTWGAHSLADIFGGTHDANRGCDDVDHASYLTDRDFDYVVMQQGSTYDVAETISSIDEIMAFFKAENPNVKFVYLCHSSTHLNQKTEMLKLLKTLEQKGIIVVDWGGLVSDLITGDKVVENSAFLYNKNTFIVNQSSSDGYHPNMLTGYITALMTFSAITGISAQDQEYQFAYDTAVNSAFNAVTFKRKYYTYGNTTTYFNNVLSSEHDMRAIQQPIDTFLENKEYQNY